MRPNFWVAVAIFFVISCASTMDYAASAESSANKSSLTHTSRTFVFALSRELLNSLPSSRVVRYTPALSLSPISLSVAARRRVKRVGAALAGSCSMLLSASPEEVGVLLSNSLLYSRLVSRISFLYVRRTVPSLVFIGEVAPPVGL